MDGETSGTPSRPATATVVGPGTLIAGRYRLEERLGAGGMAVVHDAFDVRLERRVAVKLLRPELAVDPDVRGRFQHEALAAARLSSSHVVAVYDAGDDAGVPFLVMERLPGETLHERIVRGSVHQVELRRVSLYVL